ncbi:MAG TPA: HNH endonuclease, partial [Kiritimatiellia bacterium]
MPTSVHERHVLVLNRLWQAVNVCTVDRALSLLFVGHAQVVHQEGEDFQTFGFNEWRDFSHDASHEDVVRSISLRIRIPRIILLMFFDRLP